MLEKKIVFQDAQSAIPDYPDQIIDDALAAVRDHFDMPVAYLSEFVDDMVVLRNVSAPGLEDLVKPGDIWPLSKVYCGHILEGRLPELIPDTDAVPFAQSLAVTQDVPIRSHVSLPIKRKNGSVYGMFCCLSPEPKPSLNERDRKTMQMFANLAADSVAQREAESQGVNRIAEVVKDVLHKRDFDMAYQPIYRLDDGTLASYESLCRFRPEPKRPPDIWFQEASAVGLQQELEIDVIEKALTCLRDLPPDTRVAVNASPDTIASGALWPVLARHDPNRITVEITEHEQASDFAALTRATERIRANGAWIAIDDVGAGYSGLQKILRLRPHVLKLDMSLVRDIHTDTARRALASALVHFAQDTSAMITGEGVERVEEWTCLRKLGATYAQGWLMGRPGSIAQAAPAVDF